MVSWKNSKNQIPRTKSHGIWLLVGGAVEGLATGKHAALDSFAALNQGS
jgi:hypothetical protein